VVGFDISPVVPLGLMRVEEVMWLVELLIWSYLRFLSADEVFRRRYPRSRELCRLLGVLVSYSN